MAWARIADAMRLLLAVMVLMLLSGCFRLDPSLDGNQYPDTGGETTAPATATATSSPTCDGFGGPNCDPPRRSATLYLHADDVAAFTLDVPFPHLDRCFSQEDWRAGIQPGPAGNLSLVEGERGGVLRLTGSGDLERSARVWLDDKPPCQTLRYDPWSSEPDPADGTLDLRASGSANVRVVLSVSKEDPYCWGWTSFEGAVASGWTTLTAQESMVCA